MTSMVRSATTVASPTVTANWRTCSSPGSWPGGCKASSRGRRGVCPLGFLCSREGERGLKKGWHIICAEIEWFEANVTESSLQEENISCLWNQESYNTDCLYNNRVEEFSSLAQLNKSHFSLVLVKNKLHNADSCGWKLKTELQLQSPTEKLMHIQLP